jgi:hypothetical protein
VLDALTGLGYAIETDPRRTVDLLDLTELARLAERAMPEPA